MDFARRILFPARLAGKFFLHKSASSLFDFLTDGRATTHEEWEGHSRWRSEQIDILMVITAMFPLGLVDWTISFCLGRYFAVFMITMVLSSQMLILVGVRFLNVSRRWPLFAVLNLMYWLNSGMILLLSFLMHVLWGGVRRGEDMNVMFASIMAPQLFVQIAGSFHPEESYFRTMKPSNYLLSRSLSDILHTMQNRMSQPAVAMSWLFLVRAAVIIFLACIDDALVQIVENPPFLYSTFFVVITIMLALVGIRVSRRSSPPPRGAPSRSLPAALTRSRAVALGAVARAARAAAGGGGGDGAGHAQRAARHRRHRPGLLRSGPRRRAPARLVPAARRVLPGLHPGPGTRPPPTHPSMASPAE